MRRFIPPVPPEYAAYCPEAMRAYCKNEPQRDLLQLEATYVVMVLGLLSALMGTRTFGHELLSMAREVSAGGSLSAYFVGKVLSDLPTALVYSLVRLLSPNGVVLCDSLLFMQIFTASFVLVCAPNAEFGQLYGVALVFECALYEWVWLGAFCCLFGVR